MAREAGRRQEKSLGRDLDHEIGEEAEAVTDDIANRGIGRARFLKMTRNPNDDESAEESDIVDERKKGIMVKIPALESSRLTTKAKKLKMESQDLLPHLTLDVPAIEVVGIGTSIESESGTRRMIEIISLRHISTALATVIVMIDLEVGTEIVNIDTATVVEALKTLMTS